MPSLLDVVSLCGYLSQSDYHQDRAQNYYSNRKFRVQQLVSCLTQFTWCRVGDFLCFASFPAEYQYKKINQCLIMNAKTPEMLKDSTFWIDNRFLEAQGKEIQRSKKLWSLTDSGNAFDLNKSTLHLSIPILGFSSYLPTTSKYITCYFV